MQPREVLFLSLLVTNCSGEKAFTRLKKMNQRVAVFQEKLSTLSIRYIKSDKLRQINYNEFVDIFIMKKEGQNLFHCLL